jgi:hypothetical protein
VWSSVVHTHTLLQFIGTDTAFMFCCTLTQAQAAARASIDAVRQQWESEQSRLRAAEQAIGLLKGEVSSFYSITT